jgi:outer membrane receptor protein involved in Fe transport
VSATRHGGLNYQGTAVANAVLVPGVAALRVNVGYNQQSGWIDNYSLDSVLQKKGVNDNSTAFLRLAGLFKVGDHVTVTPQFIYQDLRSSDTPVFYLQDQAYYEANPYGVPPPQASDGLYRQHKQVAEPSRDRLYIPSVNVTADLGSVDFTSVTSYYYRPYDRITDGTTFDSYILAVDFLGRPTTDRAIAALPSPVYQPVTYRTFSQEFRLASHTPAPGEKAAKWVLGAYYSDQRADYSNNDYIPGLSAAFQSIYGYSINDPANSSLANPSIANFYPNDAIYLEQGSYDTKQIALFGEVEYPLTPRLHASVGLRATHATTSTDVTQGGFYAVGTLSPVFSYTTNVSDHYNSTTPKASLVYDVTDTATVYATAGKGFRLGGELYTPLPVGAGNICAGDYATFGLGDSPKSAYDSDSLWNYEVGTKVGR